VVAADVAARRQTSALGCAGITLTPAQAIAYVRKHGIVLESASGPVPSLVQAIAGGEIEGSWWAHPRGREVFNITRAVRDSGQVLVCRLVAGKVTRVHQRLWPALVRCTDHFRPDRLSQLAEEHTASGKHVSRQRPFPNWVPPAFASKADVLSEDEALSLLRASGATVIA
jgi:hypothetical protein